MSGEWTRTPPSEEERRLLRNFVGKIHKGPGEDDCWVWTGTVTQKGPQKNYGQFAIKRKPHRAVVGQFGPEQEASLAGSVWPRGSHTELFP